ncbi:DUF4132 domain-containing protein [Cohnella sp.]|uniref:DUF4132 domain-containing protein n=1 Tax=Cohnella sp. TaxID=1883426 RepID=UPI003567821F
MNEISKERQQVKEQYYARLLKETSQLNKNQRNIAALILQEATNPYRSYDLPRKIEKLLWRPETKHIKDIFAGDEYRILEFLLGMDHAAIFKKSWDRSTDYPFSQGYLRRSYRTNEDSSVHLNHNINRLFAALEFVAQGFTWQPDILFSEAANYSYLHDYLAYELDQGNPQLLTRLQEVIYGDNSNGILTRNMIKGMLMSREPEAHRLIGELLIAAKLQEGLRQTIAESMDETSREGFIYILKIIIDKELWRFSSIVRAFDVWTGLPIEALKPAVVKKCMVAAYDCLMNVDTRNEYLGSEDSQLLYIALWSTAFNELVRTKEIIIALAQTGPNYRKVVALQFLTQCQAPEFQHEAAVRFMDEPELEAAAWAIPNLYPQIETYHLRHEETSQIIGRQASADDWRLFNQLRDVLDRIPGKEIIIKSNGLFSDVQLTTDSVCGRMLAVAYMCGDLAMYDILLDYREKMQPDKRAALVRLGLMEPVNEKQRRMLFLLLGDKSSDVRRAAQVVVDKLELTAEEFIAVEELLQFKAGDIRKAAIYLLLKQTHEPFRASIGRLLTDKKEDKRLGGLDLVLHLRDADMPELYVDCAALVKAMFESTAREKILIDQIIGVDTEQYGPDNGYGLYDPEQSLVLSEPKLPSRSFISRLFGSDSSSSPYGLESILSSSQTQLENILEQWSRLIDQHKDYEYETEQYDGSRNKRVLGTQEWGLAPLSYKGRGAARARETLDNYPLTEVWRTMAREQKLDAPRILELLYYFKAYEDYGLSLKKYLTQFPIPTVKRWFDPSVIDKFGRFADDLKYRRMLRNLLEVLLDECDPEESFAYINQAVLEIYDSLKPALEKHSKLLNKQEAELPDFNYSYHYNDKILFSDMVNVHEIRFWIEKMKAAYQTNDQCFEAGFVQLYRFARINEREANEVIDLLGYARALESGVITANEMYREILGRPAGVAHLRSMGYDQVKRELPSYPKGQRLVEEVIHRVVGIELKRGDSDTPVSRLAQQIKSYEGMRYMVQCLLSLGSKDSLARGYLYSWAGTTKKEMISHLLKSCHPAEGEDANTLRQLLQAQQISDKRLIDVAMYAPQWVSIIEEYLSWPGLSSVCWYFHAHVSEMFSNEKETMVARYSPIPPIDLNEGAFDISWFLEAYNMIGEERFKLVYESAKYISDGANHRRAQLFSDAVLGRLEVEEIERELSTKRNKNHVLCYGLIPLSQENRSEALIHRYEIIQRFAKESKQFGAQRRDSESKAVRLALDNLARNAGFSDVTRMSWKVEADQFRQIASHLEPVTIDQWQINLSIDEWGKASLNVAKDGKPVKSIPDKLKKNEIVLQLKGYQNLLRDQYRRSRDALEKAMVMEEPFTIEELRSMQENKVIAPLIGSLVFKSGDTLGYFEQGGFKAPGGQTVSQAREAEILIAHPVHLFQSGHWAAYQRDLITRKVVQPFKQVFRELYRPNEDEQLEGMSSSRYAGHQIQPRKAAALFKSRLWTVSHEEGLQKVFHKQDIIATMYALADWFSPAEVEAPTIQTVTFYSRRSGKSIHLTEVPAVIFSEVMRDIDLVVSVAHVGGVDPEASLSTVEMRAALVRELLPLLKLGNVEIKGSHAYIAGSLGEYTVHLGSGVVHRMAAGALHIIPVHSQHRGRIFLPFVDEDPRTAEIISKVLLLAEDHKLKDPTILVQIKG